MYILIVGCSEVGYHLTKALLASGHEVVAIEKNRSRFQFLTDELGSVAFAGDGAEERTLKQAGITRADVLVAVTGRDETNLVICQMAKHIFRVPRTMALVKDPKNEPIFHVLGVDVVVNEIHQILTSFEEGVPGRPFVHLMNLRAAGTELVSVSLPEDLRV
jgi:trk system potassium uptake protein TrkA